MVKYVVCGKIVFLIWPETGRSLYTCVWGRVLNTVLSVQKCRLLSSSSGLCGTQDGCAHPSGIVWYC